MVTLAAFGVGGLLLGCLLSVFISKCWREKQRGEKLLMDDLYVDITQSNLEK
jgi:hypothetical protein